MAFQNGVNQALRRASNGTQFRRLTIGEFPPNLANQMRVARKYRRDLEAAVLEVKPKLDWKDAHLIDECVSAEIHAAVCRVLLRTKIEKMSVTDVLLCSKEILKAKSIRNAAFEKLGLDKMEANTIDALYERVDLDDDDTPTTFTPAAIEADHAADLSSNCNSPTDANVEDRGNVTNVTGLTNHDAT